MSDLAYGGLLPTRVRFWIVECGALAETQEIRSYHDDGRTRTVRAAISIDPRLIWCEKLFVRELLHEVVHLGRPDLEHGVEFEREMLRVRECLGGDQLW